MKQIQFLHELIRSLTITEKSYFKRTAAMYERDGGNVYLRLFDAIAAQDDYNEDKIKEQFKDDSFIKQLPVAKNYLYNLLLRTLESFHARNSEADLKHLLIQAQLLIDKRLYHQAYKMLRKIRETATEQERFMELWQTIQLEIRVTPFLDIKEPESSIQQAFQEMETLLLQLTDFQDALKTRRKTYKLFSDTSSLRDNENIAKVDALLAFAALQNPETALSVRAKSNRYHTLTSIHYIRRDYSNAFDATNQLLNIELAYPATIENKIQHINTINNYLILCVYTDKKSAFEEKMAYLSSLNLDTLNEKVRRFSCIQTIKLQQYIYGNEYQTFPAFIQDYQTNITQYINSIPRVEILENYRDIAYIYHILGNYEESHNWLIKLNPYISKDTREDFLTGLRIQEMILFFDKKNLQILDSLIISVQRFLIKRNRFLQTERLIVNFFKKIIDVSDKKTQQKMYAKLKEDLIDLVTKHPEEAYFFEHFDIYSWINAKTNNTTFVEEKKKMYYPDIYSWIEAQQKGLPFVKKYNP